MGYDPTFTVPITHSFLEESWDYSSGICAGVVYLVVITRWQNPATAHLVGHDRNPTCHRLAGMLKYFNCPPCEIASQVTHNSLLPVTQWKTLNSRQNSSSPLKGIRQSSSRLNVLGLQGSRTILLAMRSSRLVPESTNCSCVAASNRECIPLPVQ